MHETKIIYFVLRFVFGIVNKQMEEKMNIIDYVYNNGNKTECCGCTACMEVCPKDAITMKPDEKGYFYPAIDKELCIDCGLCGRTCGFVKEDQKTGSEKPLKAIGLKHKNKYVRQKSRSGGAFTVITDYVLENGGCIFGVVLDNDNVVRHILAEDSKTRDKMRGSKYVQSDMNHCFRKAKEQLDNGRLVAFSGTACQIDGLKSYLRKDYENLITIDIVCHGVPSPKLWKDYLDYINKRYKRGITDFDFRDKSILGWDMHLESFKVNKKKIVARDYSRLFQKNLNLRESCFNCKYCSLNRVADFTLADFWGVDAFRKGFNDNKGISLLFVNTQKAIQIYKNAGFDTEVELFECENYNFSQPNLKAPTQKPENYDQFWEDYTEKGFEHIVNHNVKNGFIDNLKFKKSLAIIYFKRKVLKK